MNDFDNSISGGDQAKQQRIILCDVHDTLIVKDGHGGKCLNDPLINLLQTAQDHYDMKIVINSSSLDSAKSDLSALGFDLKRFANFVTKDDARNMSCDDCVVMGFDDMPMIQMFYKAQNVAAFAPDEIQEASNALEALDNQSGAAKPGDNITRKPL